MHRYLILSTLSTAIIMAHGGEDHSKKTVKKPTPTEIKTAQFKSINSTYIADIKPIFEAKCFACHAEKPKDLPWYYSVPGVKQLMDYDMNTAKKHMDFKKDFPFLSHGSPTLDLKSLKEVIAEGDMPPLRYRVIHWESGLTNQEAKTVTQWIDNSLKLLQKSQ